MKCPLFAILDKLTQLGEESDYCECLKEACAVWDDKYQQCVNITIGEQLLRIANALNSLLDKMPHEGQFRR